MEGGAEVTKIPSEEAFARAKRMMAEDSRGLDAACSELNKRFEEAMWFHRVYILSQRDVDFRAYVFFKKDKDVEDSKGNGTTTAIEDAVYKALERYGRGKRSEIVVGFEWDSDENVDKKYDGDYLLRLR